MMYVDSYSSFSFGFSTKLIHNCDMDIAIAGQARMYPGQKASRTDPEYPPELDTKNVVIRIDGWDIELLDGGATFVSIMEEVEEGIYDRIMTHINESSEW